MHRQFCEATTGRSSAKQPLMSNDLMVLFDAAARSEIAGQQAGYLAGRAPHKRGDAVSA
jgi:hypothetical protein